MPPHRLRPRPHPVEEYDMAVLVAVTRLEIAHLLAVSCRAHLVPGVVEIVGMDELHRAAAHHLRGLVTEDGADARTDLHEIAGGIGHQDEVLRSLEDALALLDLAIERPLGALALGDVA